MPSHPESTTRFATSADGTRIAYSVVGNGPALILVDGALCHRRVGPMAELKSALSEFFTVYHFDRRGRGESEDRAPYKVEREVEDVLSVVSAAGGRAMLFGQSSGAALAVRVAAESSAITRMALYEPPFRTRVSGVAEYRNQQNRLIELLDEKRLSEAVRYFQTDVVGLPSVVLNKTLTDFCA